MYIKFFGLHKNPFTTLPDPAFFYESPDHREALAALQHGIDNDKGCMVVTGEVGTGKTTLARFLVNSLTDSVISIYIDYPFDSLIGLLKILADRIGVNFDRHENVVEMAAKIRERLLHLAQEGKKVVIIIDEAQNLSSESLEYVRLISNIHAENRRLLNIVLVGQNELGDKIKSEKMKPLFQRITIWKTLKPLNREETENYIRHRMLLAGSYEIPFTKGALKLIHKRTKGIPRLINLMCDGLLLLGYAENRRKISARMARQITRGELIPLETVRGNFFDARLLVVSLLCLALFFTIALLKKEVFFYRSVKASSPYVASPEKMVTLSPSLNINPDEVFKLDNIERAASIEVIENSPLRHFQGRFSDGKSQIIIPGNNAEALAKAKKIKVQPGDYLLKLIKEHYGKVNSTLLDLVRSANPGLKDINLIRSGQNLVFPGISEDTFIISDIEGRYFVHVFSSFTRDEAQDMLLKLKELSDSVFLRSFTEEGSTVYRVYVGPFDSYEDAIIAFRKIPKEHLPF
ncbi:AAA family ATPase [Thermodesulforhabdus norvegica]|uniref:Sporulation related domain-containing protein n=1 Tax=Thermodesulforhabdus norvegica TaxID=39841 RepID=A0A1I4WD99_9BACT|nr:AAA family ATPase [Thermodesulforhabdus norvegica]SFN10969.1 Sporulation related domain-containing protein [Thermodesulforhabdus norvegica]